MPATINDTDCAVCLTEIAVGYVCADCAESIPDMPGEFPGDFTQWVDECDEIWNTYDEDMMEVYAEAVRMGIVELARDFRNSYHSEVEGTVEDYFRSLYHDMHGGVPYELENYIDWGAYAEDMLGGGNYILLEASTGDHVLMVY